MEPDKSISDPQSQTALQEAELAALLRMLSISEGTFSLSIAICNSPALREYLIGKIQEEKAGIEIIQIEKNTTRVFSFVEEKINNKTPSAIFISEIEKVLPSDDVHPKIIRTLNASRELWQERFSCPIVFWLPEYAATILQKEALDFASWISHTFEFISEQATAMAGMQDAYAGDISSAGRLDADQKRFRIAELEQRIKEVGDPPKAELVRHVLTWLDELAYVHFATGDLEKAKQNILRSLKICEKPGLQAQTAHNLGHLGLIYIQQSDLDQAEQMINKALEIDEKLGRLEGIATHCGNLGLIHKTRGDLDQAEQMHNKALEIDERLGRPDGMANQYANLGLIYQTRGDLDQAEQMHSKALEIDKKIGRLEGMANHYGNLGLIYWTRGDLDQAEQMHNKALEINKSLGRLDGMAINYGNLGLIYSGQRNFGQAEQFVKKSLEINEKLERLEGLARDYSNLGSFYQQRGIIEKAREYWEKALEIFKKIGMKPEIEKVQGWIDGLKDVNKVEKQK